MLVLCASSRPRALPNSKSSFHLRRPGQTGSLKPDSAFDAKKKSENFRADLLVRISGRFIAPERATVHALCVGGAKDPQLKRLLVRSC